MVNRVIAGLKASNKAEVNQALLDWFTSEGGAENNALDVIMRVLHDNNVNLSRKQVIGKLTYSGVKQVVKKPEKPEKVKDNGPTKKEVLASICSKTGVSMADFSTFLNVKKNQLILLDNLLD